MRWRFLLAGAVLLAGFFGSFALGRYPVPPVEVLKILLSRVFPIEQTWTPEMTAAVLNIRLPRIAAACLVGAGLSASGAAYQGVFGNPMASPDILGASGGAAAGAALAIVNRWSASLVTLCAFAGSLLAVSLACLAARRAKGASALILAGIMIGSLCTAATSYLKLVADPSSALPQITYWLMGSLSGIQKRDLLLAAPVTAAGLIPLFLLRWRINLLALGDDEARALGVNAKRLRLTVIVSSTLVTAAAVSVSGVIGWVGLVVPHLCRKWAGGSFRELLPASLLGGAAFLLLVDDLARSLMAAELPLGILTALAGTPFFLALLAKKSD